MPLVTFLIGLNQTVIGKLIYMNHPRMAALLVSTFLRFFLPCFLTPLFRFTLPSQSSSFPLSLTFEGISKSTLPLSFQQNTNATNDQTLRCTQPNNMQPPNLYTAQPTDLDAALSCAGMGTAWRHDAPPSPVWPATYNPRPNRSTALSTASSPSSLTDRDLSRRALAASGLDVSAPEFVPSFLASSTPPPPSHQIPFHPSPPQHPTHQPEPSPQHQSYFNEPLPYDHDQPAEHFSHQDHGFHHDQDDRIYDHHISNLPYYQSSEPLYDHNPSTDPLYDPLTEHSLSTLQNPYEYESSLHSPSYYHSQNHTPPRPVDKATYVSAVQHFDQQFPVLGKTRQPKVQTPPTNTPTSPHLLHSALAWDALQRQQKHHQQHQHLQSQLASDHDPDEEDLFDLAEEQPRLTNDIGALWVTTGQSVGQLYQSLRAEAAEEARLRNKYFDRAAAAFKKNDGASAKRLGALGREANLRMKELHHRAAEAIFQARNPPHVTDIVDLHGLHVSEALERLPPALGKALPGTLRILTGTGHHTKGTGRARLRPAVKKWLQDEGYFFEEVVDANEFVGSFKVEISR